MKTIVSATWLNENLSNPKLIILDASMATNASGKAFDTYKYTIPNARCFNIKHDFTDSSSSFPNTVPKPNDFERECRKLGINTDSEIVVFDTHGVYSSPRVWWLFQVMGHTNIAVLDGGLPAWTDKSFLTSEKHLDTFKPGNFKAEYKAELVITYKQVKQNIAKKEFLLVDARSAERFKGIAPEPRKELQSGHIPNSVNLPFQEVLHNRMFKPKDELQTLFENTCRKAHQVVFSCGSGLTACIIMLAHEIAYGNSPKIYDGSWTEWAERNALKLLE